MRRENMPAMKTVTCWALSCLRFHARFGTAVAGCVWRVAMSRCTPLLAKCHTAMRPFQNVSKLRNSEFILWIKTVVVKDRVGIGKQVLWSLTDKALKEFTWKIPAPINEPEAKMFTWKTTYFAPWHWIGWANSLILGVCVGRRSKMKLQLHGFKPRLPKTSRFPSSVGSFAKGGAVSLSKVLAASQTFLEPHITGTSICKNLDLAKSAQQQQKKSVRLWRCNLETKAIHAKNWRCPKILIVFAVCLDSSYPSSRPLHGLIQLSKACDLRAAPT